MSNSHLLFQLPQYFISLLPKQRACFSSVLISFPKWLLQFLLTCSSTYPPSTPRTASSLAALTSSCSLLPTHSKKAHPTTLGPRSHCCFHPGFLSFLHAPACSMFPFCCGSVSAQEDHHLFIAICSLCLQFSRCQLDAFLMFLLTHCMQTHGLEISVHRHASCMNRGVLQSAPSFTNRAGEWSGAEVL